MQSKQATVPQLDVLWELYVEQGQRLPPRTRRALLEDPRKRAKALLAAVDRRKQAAQEENTRLRRMLRFERELFRNGCNLVAGIDEAGMSPLAGPVVAAAAMMPKGWKLPFVNDSKKLSADTRQALAAQIKEQAVSYGIGIVSPQEIDEINIYHAGLLAMKRAYEQLTPAPEALLIDARALKDVAVRQVSLIKGDARSLFIAAASILAKTHRDGLMLELDKSYPGYGLAQHKGYPVKQHVEALQKLGASPIHRRSFAPVRAVLSPAQQND